ncbi:MAG: PRC-barrel domain-containing protein [Desulfatiglandales bacterium]
MSFSKNKTIAACLFIILIFVGLSSGAKGEEEESTILASRIIDRDVYDEKQEPIGEVDDIIMRRSGKVKRLSVEFGGFMDIGDRLVSVPFKAIIMKDGKVVLDSTKQQLEKKPELHYYEEGLRPEYYYRPRPFAGTYRYAPPGYYYGPPAPNLVEETLKWAFSPSRFLASTILNRRLINEEGKSIGRVKDLVINRENHRVEKIVIFSEDILGKDIHVALDYEPLGFTAFGLVYDIEPGDLKDFIYPYKE